MISFARSLLFLFWLLFFVGCGGGGSSSTPLLVDNLLSYSKDNMSISGYIKLQASEVQNSDTLFVSVTYKDMSVSIPGCRVASFSIQPDPLVFDDQADTIKTLQIIVELDEPCDKTTLELKSTKSTNIITKVNGKEYEDSSTSVVKNSFSIENPSGYIANNSYFVSIDPLETNMKIDETLTVFLRVFKKNDLEEIVSNNIVKSISVSIKTPEILNIIQDDGKEVDNIIYGNSATKEIILKSFNRAGLAILEVKATIDDGVEEVKITKDFNILVQSGPVNSMSIVYVSSSYDSGSGLFNDNYTVHAVDKYGNPANKGESIYVGLINEVNKEAFDGNIYNNNDNETFFSSGSLDYGAVKLDDRLVVLATENKKDSKYLGGWSIDSIGSNFLSLQERYYSVENTSSLRFAIGDERRANTCNGSLALADIDSSDGKYTIGDNGLVSLNLKYDSFMVGKDIYMYANSITENSRVGASIKRKLTGTGIKYEITGDVTDDGKCTVLGTCKAKITFLSNDSEQKLQNIKVPITFTGAGCSIATIDKDVDCNGIVNVEVNNSADPEANPESTCKISWDNIIYWE